MLFRLRRIGSVSQALLAWLPPTVLALVTSVIYLKTILPGMGGSGDTAKFQFIGKVLGIPHGPGYPLYILLNWLFVQLPFGSVAYRANFMSAFFSVLTVMVFYCLALELFRSSLVSLFISFLFAFSLSFWSHSVIAEVYTLNSFFLGLIFISLVKWRHTLRPHWLCLFLLLYPISFGNHLTMITLLPAVLLFVASVKPSVMIQPRFIATGLGGVTATLGLYSYLFIRSFQRAPFLEHQVVDWESFLNVISAQQFRSAMFSFSLRQLIVERIPLFFRHLASEWTIPLLLIAVLGFFYLFKQQGKVALLFVLSFLGQAFYILNYDIPDLEPFFIPVVLIIALFTASGLNALFVVTKRFPLLKYLIVFGLSLTIVLIGASNYPKADRSRERKQDIRLTTLFSSIPEGSVIITDSYLDKQYVYYKLFVDFPEKALLHLEISSQKENIRDQISMEIIWKIRTSRELQKRLFPDAYGLLSPDEMEALFRQDYALQEKLLAHVYLISQEAMQACAKQGLKIKGISLRAPGSRQKFTFFQLFLLSESPP